MPLPAPRLLPALLAALLAVLLAAPAPAAAESDDIEARAKARAIRNLGRTLRKLARSPYLDKKRDELNDVLDSLEVLGGPQAAEAMLGGVAIEDEGVRERIFALVEKDGEQEVLEPLLEILEEKDYRRDHDLKRRVAHALAVVGDPKAIEPLTELVGFDEDAEVVAAVADALATFASVPTEQRKEPVKRLIDLYSTTWNLMMSMRREDRVLSKVAKERWRTYSKPVRAALQTLTGQQITRPPDWRDWWNDHKKDRTWEPGTASDR